MSKTANVFTRVDPELKEQAESILDDLGISMSTAMGVFLKQIVLQKGLPFDIKLPKQQPIAYGALSEDEFNALMDGAAKSYASGKGISVEQFEKDFGREIGL